jgi:ubiquinone/menaquinone biosynthesis C-methylase UbiE
MTSQKQRARGVTPELARDYGTRTAYQQAAFVLPHLRPSISLLDIGCGPGTITLGLAETVAPGYVIGIDYDAAHVEEAKARAEERGMTNVTFQLANALSLPFGDGTFDAVF